MKKFSLFRVALIGILLAASFISYQLETRRMTQPLPGFATTDMPPELDRTQLLRDVEQLSAPQFEGRKTGTAGNRKARALIAARFASLGLSAFHAGYAQPFSFTHKSMKGLFTPGLPYATPYPDAANLIAYVPGTATPQKFLVISAHYDHLGMKNGLMHPGADDNASGVATLLALAAWFKAHPPQHSIVFAAFDAEEVGKQGAKAFMAALPFAKEQLVMNLNLDMLGHNDSNEIFASGLYHWPQLRPYLDEALKTSTVRVLSGHDRPGYQTGMIDDWTGSSDHSAFHDAGIPYLYFGVEDHADYHAATDTFANLNQRFLGKVAELVLQTARVLDRNLGRITR